MKFDYKYSGNSAVINNATSSEMSFVPDVTRDPTFFVGNLGKQLSYREAMSALHKVVVSDMRFQARDLTNYKEWLKQQEPIWLAEAMEGVADVKAQLSQVQQELQFIRNEQNKIMSPFNIAKRKYFDYIYTKNRDLWFVLDPVITVHPDELFFECFSKDESAYAKLSCKFDVFDQINEFSCGTTNIDYSYDLYNEFQKIRNYKQTSLKIEPSGFSVATTNEDVFKEVKIDLPDSWVRGFLQVSSAMTMPMIEFDLHPMDLHNFCRILRQNKEKNSPRSVRFQLKSGQPVKAIFEPWNKVVECPRSIFNGKEDQEIRIWGRRRLLVLERLIPIAKSIRVSLLGTGMPSFYRVDLGHMTFTLGLSGWTANDWSRVGNFDLMAPRAEVDAMTQQKVFLALKENWFESADSLAYRLRLDKSTVLSSLSAFTQAGRAIYDMDKKVFRLRELSRETLPIDSLRFSSDREKNARELVNQGGVTVKRNIVNSDNIRLAGKIVRMNKTFNAEITIDKDERLSEGSCTCYFYSQNKLFKGPCEHMLAIRMLDSDNRNSNSWKSWFNND